jgi:hypothetical protein
MLRRKIGLSSHDGQPFPNPVREGLPTTRELIGLVNLTFLMEIECEAKIHLICQR